METLRKWPSPRVHIQIDSTATAVFKTPRCAFKKGTIFICTLLLFTEDFFSSYFLFQQLRPNFTQQRMEVIQNLNLHQQLIQHEDFNVNASLLSCAVSLDEKKQQPNNLPARCWLLFTLIHSKVLLLTSTRVTLQSEPVELPVATWMSGPLRE